MPLSIVLHPGPVINNISNDKFIIMNIDNYSETANSMAFTEAKFAGVVCLNLLNNRNIILANAEKFVTKNKKFMLSFKISKLKIPIDYYIVNNQDSINETNQVKSLNLRNCKTIELSELDTLLIDDLSVPTTNSNCNCSITYGLGAKFAFNSTPQTGHCTVAFGVEISTYDQVLAIENELMKFYGTYKGLVINLTIDGTNGGSVIYIPDLCLPSVQHTHITFNTTIRSVLSTNIIEQYLNGETQFKLSDIDTKSKSNSIIVLDTDLTTDVLIDATYAYTV